MKMKKSYLSLLFISYFATGIIVPVLSLIIIARGCTLPEIAILMGIYSFTVFILELPSGILSDMLGRKKIFLISCALNLAASFSLLFISGFVLLIPAMMVFGAGRAFSTGSIDALLLDDYIETHGKEGLSKATSALAIVETTGICAGTILGGFLPGLSERLSGLGSFDLSLIVRAVIFSALIVLTFIFIKEEKPHEEHRISLKTHLRTGFSFLKSSPIVVLLAFSFMLAGLFVAPVEAYWQPAFTALLPSDSLLYTVGLLSFGTFAFAAAGTLFAKRFVLSSENHLGVKYTVSRLLLFGVFIILALQKNVIWFGGMFILLYFIFAGSNVIGSTMLNLEVPAALRASMLSLISLFFQAGAMLSPLFSSVIVEKNSISTLWFTFGISLVVLSLIAGLALIRLYKRKTDEKQQQDTSKAR